MRSLSLALCAALGLAIAAPCVSQAQSRPAYAWCSAADKTDNTVYYSDVFDVAGQERDVSGQWYGAMQYRHPNVDLRTAACFIVGQTLSRETARADRDQYVRELRSGFSVTPIEVDTRWTVHPNE